MQLFTTILELLGMVAIVAGVFLALSLWAALILAGVFMVTVGIALGRQA